MPGAIIAIDQARPGPTTSFGTPGVARNDLWQSRLVTCRSTVGGNTTYLWEFLSIPAGSAATLTGTSAANCTFTPDLPGSYRVQLTTNGGGPGNVQILIAAVRYDSLGVLQLRGWRVPAIGEALSENNFLGQTRGWSEAYEFMLADLVTVANALVGGVSAGANNDVQYAEGGTFAADTGLFTYDPITHTLAAPSMVATTFTGALAGNAATATTAASATEAGALALPVKVSAYRTTAISSAVTVADQHVTVTSNGTTQTLPAAPAADDTYRIRSKAGVSCLINGNGHNFDDGNPTYTQSVAETTWLLFNGTTWEVF